MERNRAMAKYPLQWFYALHEILIPQGIADVLFTVKSEGECIAGVVLVHSATSSHYLHNGSVGAYLEHRPNDLIVDSIIQKGVEEGKTTLDFMGSDPNDLSLLRFKEKWGSQSRDIYTYVKDYHPFRSKIWEWGKGVMNSRLGSWFLRRIR
jgi:lipid II:glycine glycyltransferase (peptidoglycan interpeptide bridge formation enzyme)